jgi:nitroreductase
MDLFEAINSRASVREYQDKPVSRELLACLIDAGRRAPTANNLQPWEFVVITEAGARAKVADIADHGKFIAQAAVCIAVYCKDTKYYLEDGCAAVENILLAATAFGLGTCWIAGDKKPYSEKIGRLLHVPEIYRLVALISVGYPKAALVSKTKRPTEQVLHWEQF